MRTKIEFGVYNTLDKYEREYSFDTNKRYLTVDIEVIAKTEEIADTYLEFMQEYIEGENSDIYFARCTSTEEHKNGYSAYDSFIIEFEYGVMTELKKEIMVLYKESKAYADARLAGADREAGIEAVTAYNNKIEAKKAEKRAEKRKAREEAQALETKREARAEEVKADKNPKNYNIWNGSENLKGKEVKAGQQLRIDLYSMDINEVPELQGVDYKEFTEGHTEGDYTRVYIEILAVNPKHSPEEELKVVEVYVEGEGWKAPDETILTITYIRKQLEEGAWQTVNIKTPTAPTGADFNKDMFYYSFPIVPDREEEKQTAVKAVNNLIEAIERHTQEGELLTTLNPIREDINALLPLHGVVDSFWIDKLHTAFKEVIKPCFRMYSMITEEEGNQILKALNQIKKVIS